MTEEIKLPEYLLKSEESLYNIDESNEKLKELKKTGDIQESYPYLKGIEKKYLYNPECQLKSTGTQLRYLYNDKDFNFKDIIKETPDFKYTPEKINEIYENKCNIIGDENIKDIKKIIAIGDIHGDYKQLIYILKKYNIIKKTEPYQITITFTDEDKNVPIREKYKNETISDFKTFDFDYELNKDDDDIDNIIVIQVGDQLTGYREINTKAYELTKFNDKEDEKVLVFMDQLRIQAKKAREELRKNIYIKSLIGNHEFTNLRGIYSKCSEKDNSCIEYFTNPDLRKDRRTFIKSQLQNLLCNRDYFFTYNGIVFAHCGIVNSVLEKIDKLFPHLNIIENLKKLETLEEKINYYNKLVKILIYIKITSIKDDDIKLKSIPNQDPYKKPIDIFNSLDEKAFADLANSKAAINDKEGKNIKNVYNIFHLNNMVVGHEMIYNGIEKKIYVMDKNNEIQKIYHIIDGKITVYKKDGDSFVGSTITDDDIDIKKGKNEVNVFNIDTGSNSFVGINEERKPDFTFIDRNTKKRISPPGFNNQLLKQVLIIDITNKDEMIFKYDTIERIDTTKPYIKYSIEGNEKSQLTIDKEVNGYKIYGEQ